IEMDSRAPLGGGALFYLCASRRKPNCGTILLMDMLTRSGAETAWIVDRAKAEGFDLCGVVRAEKFPELAHTPEWLERGYAGEMNYLRDPRRSDPQSVLKGIRSVIVCALNYNTAKPYSTIATAHAESGEPRGWISRYAWGQDYHGVLQERILAKYAGLGWIGKNTLLLNQGLGSFFFLGVILTTLELAPTLAAGEAPPPDLCGTCRRCIDECSTEALVEPYVMD